MNATTNKTNGRDEAAMLWWLTATSRGGSRRIERLGWKRLAGIYRDCRPGSEVRKAIEREARRCGYTPRTILNLNAE